MKKFTGIAFLLALFITALLRMIGLEPSAPQGQTNEDRPPIIVREG